MREIVSDNIFYTLFVSNFEIKFLKEEDPTNDRVLASFLSIRHLSAEWSVKMVVLDLSK